MGRNIPDDLISMPSIASIPFSPSAVLGVVVIGDGGIEVRGGE